jgi:chromosome segregation ATPase
MKRLNVWLLGLSIVVPTMLAFSAGGDTRGGVRQFTTAQLLAYVQWTVDQQQKRTALRIAREAQVKPLHDQIRQLELQIRAIDLQFEQNESALLTPDQIAAAQVLLQQLEVRRAEERRLAEERRHLEGEHWADERIHHGSTTRPADTTDVVRRNEADRHLTVEERRVEAERRAAERRHEEHNATGKTDHPVLSREERQQERERLHQEIERMNHQLNELREEKEAGKPTAPAPTK